MGMSSGGGGGGIRSEINVTPLVDVVLVLLIIFMVIIPVLQQGHPVVTPPKSKNPTVVVAPPDQIVVRMDRQGRMYINKEVLPPAQFATRLKTATTGREDKVVFFAADGELPYGQVADFLDLARDSGAKNLGIVFGDLSTTP
jgi:biopolymer transport protein TolR